MCIADEDMPGKDTRGDARSKVDGGTSHERTLQEIVVIDEQNLAVCGVCGPCGSIEVHWSDNVNCHQPVHDAGDFALSKQSGILSKRSYTFKQLIQ